MSSDDDPNDPKQFHVAVGHVRRIVTDRADLGTRRPIARALHRRRDDAAARTLFRNHPLTATDLQPGDEVSFLRPGLQRKLLRDLRRGRFRVEDEIDLHGLIAVEADRVLGAFLVECREAHRLCVRIVHGKGHRSSAQGPVLKHLVDQRLRQRDDVIAFCSAPPTDGGTGAVYVLLQKP
jgi:DNA-nicking Smr family endonuclease